MAENETNGDAGGLLPQPTEEVHLPGPSYLPVIVAFSTMFVLVGLVNVWPVSVDSRDHSRLRDSAVDSADAGRHSSAAARALSGSGRRAVQCRGPQRADLQSAFLLVHRERSCRTAICICDPCICDCDSD